MLWQRVQIAGVGILKGCKRHGVFGGELDGFLVNHLNSRHAFRSLLKKAVIAHTLKSVKHQSGVGNHRARQTAEGKFHVLCRDGRTVGPYSVLVDMNYKILIILGGNTVCQHGLKVQLPVKLHKGQELEPHRIFVNPGLVYGKGIDPSQGIRHADIDNPVCGRCRITA